MRVQFLCFVVKPREHNQKPFVAGIARLLTGSQCGVKASRPTGRAKEKWRHPEVSPFCFAITLGRI